MGYSPWSHRVIQDWVTNTHARARAHTHTHTHTHTQEQLWIKLLPILNAYKQGQRPLLADWCGYPWLELPLSFLRVSLVAQMVKNLPTIQEAQVRSLGRKIPWRKEWLPTSVFLPGECHGQSSLAGYKLRVRYNWLTNTFDSLASLNLSFLIHKMGMITSLLLVPELLRGLNVLKYIIHMKVEYKYIEY